MARAGAIRGAQLAALVALHDRDQHLPERDRTPAQARAADRLRTGTPTRTWPRASRSSSRSGWSPIRTRHSGSRTDTRRPEASYERRESVELAFIAALQHLPPNQRAVLILREVLGFSAKEVAETARHDGRVGQQRAAASAGGGRRAGRASAASRQTLRSLGDDGIKDLVTRYVDAWEHNDVEAFAAMLTEDATFAMPPLSSWYRGREAIAAWAAAWPMSGAWRWRSVQTTANGQLALGFYAWSDEDQRYRPFALNVLTLRGDQVSDVTAFIARSAAPREREVFERYPDEPVDSDKATAVFERFGLPEEL